MLVSRLLLYSFTIVLVCFFSIAKSQVIIQGKILDSQQIPLSNASIKIKDSAKALPRFFAISNNTGIFRLKIPSNQKTFWIECSLLGYRNTSFLYTIPADSNAGVFYRNIVLVADTAALPEINVFTTPPVTVNGDTTTFRVDAFKKGTESNVGELLNSLPGFSVNNGRISYNGRAVNTVMIEDDDLFGSDYNTITQNLSPKGIEKIQLIQNYNDKTYLANRLKKGDELAVNIKFNKKYLYRVITSNEAGLSFSPAADFYKIRQNIVSLIPRFKSVTTTNFNNTGVLASEIIGTVYNIPELARNRNDAVNFDLYPQFPAEAVARLSDISSPVIPKNRMSNNHTTVISNNSLFKPSKKFQAKAIGQYYRDAYHQQQEQTIDYSLSGINLFVQNKQFVNKQLPVFNISTEAVYSPSVSTQLIYKANFSTQHENDSLNDLRQSSELYTVLKSRARRFQQQLGFSFAIDSNHVFDIRTFHNSSIADQQVPVFPANIYSGITSNTRFDQIVSAIRNNSNEYTLQAKLTGRNKKSNWSAELLYSGSRSDLSSGITLLRADSSLKLTNTTLQNTTGYKTRKTGLLLGYYLNISKKLRLRTLQQFETGKLWLTNHSRFHEKNYTNYLPSVKFSYSLTNNNRIEINADFKNRLAQIQQLPNGYVFVNANSISRGADSLLLGVSKTISLVYSFSNMTKRKVYGFLNLTYARNPVIYLMNNDPTTFYTLSNNMAWDREAGMLNMIGFLSKYISGIKSQLDLSVSRISFSDFYSTNSKTGTLGFQTVSGSMRIKTLVSDNLIPSLTVKATVNEQTLDKKKSSEINNQAITYSIATDLIYRIHPKWLFTVKYQYIQQRQNRQKYSAQFADLQLKCTAIKDKLYFMLSGNNLLNSGRFTNVTFTPNSIITQNIYMQRSFWMLHATLEL